MSILTCLIVLLTWTVVVAQGYCELTGLCGEDLE